jgi:DNA repair exonuclease SbcCD ATPase subunit
MIKLYWHVHHDVLLETSANIQGRIDYIRAEKPEDEIETRLRLLKEVQRQLPEAVIQALATLDRVWATLDRVWAALDQARTAYAQVWAAAALDQAWTAYAQVRTALDQARTAYAQVRTALDQARAALDQALRDHAAEIEALHWAECPDCPWNGETIFP